MSKKNLCIVAMCLGILVTMLDTTIMNIALPSVKISLNTSLDALSWALNGYTITFAAFTIPLGKLANIYGKKGFYLMALILFGLGSILSGLSPLLSILILGRVIQSIGAALLFPLSMDLAISTQPDEKKGKAALFVGITQGGASAAGPIIGGIITQWLGWRYIFLINVPIVLLSFLISLYALPIHLEKERTSVDLGGTLFAIISLSIMTLLITQGRVWKLTMPTIIFLILFVISSFVFFIIEKRASAPIIDFKLFTHKNFNIATVGTILGQFFLVGFMVVMPTFLTTVFRMSEFSAALLVTPATLMIFLTAPFAGKAIKYVTPLILLATGFLSISFGFILLGYTQNPINYGLYVLGSGLIGIGYGLIVGPVSLLSTKDLKGSMLTSSQSVIGVLRQLGTVLSVAIFISFLSDNLSKAKTLIEITSSFSNLFLYASPFIFIISISLFITARKQRSQNNEK